MAKDGIGCTAQLGHAMDKAATGIRRKLLSAILQSEAARAKYTPKPGERNAGTKSVDVVSMFGPVGTISRTYYYDKASRRGHYPWDEQMGLVGRYTPALVEEVARAAQDDPYRKAAEEFTRAYHFEMSGDTMQHIVEQLRAELTSFVKLPDLGPKEDANGEVDVVYVLADGTGLPFRRSALKGVKGKNGKAKTREVKLGVVFIGGVDSEGRPFRLQDTTTYVATTHRWGKFMKLLRAEFDRRFGKKPRRVVFLSDGGKWLRSVKLNEFPFATAILDFYHATEHLEPVLGARAEERDDEVQGEVPLLLQAHQGGQDRVGDQVGGIRMPEVEVEGHAQGPQVLQGQRRQDALRRIHQGRALHRVRTCRKRM